MSPLWGDNVFKGIFRAIQYFWQGKNPSKFFKFLIYGGKGGIRTHGTLLKSDQLATDSFRPLSHLSIVHTNLLSYYKTDCWAMH